MHYLLVLLGKIKTVALYKKSVHLSLVFSIEVGSLYSGFAICGFDSVQVLNMRWMA